MPTVKATVKWGGSRTNKVSEVWLQFIIEDTDDGLGDVAATRCVLLKKKHCYIYAKWPGQNTPRLLGVAAYNGKVDTPAPHWEYHVSFRTDDDSINWELLQQLKKAVVKKKKTDSLPFEVVWMTVDEVEERKKAKQALPDQEEEDDEEDYEEEDLEGEEDDQKITL